MLTPGPVDYTVTNTSDSGSGSLRNAITEAVAGNQTADITFASDLTGDTITAVEDDPNTNNIFGPTAFVVSGTANITIDASTAPGLVLSGGGAERLFAVTSSATLVLNDITLSGGLAAGGAGGDSGDVTAGGGGAGLGGALFDAGGSVTATGATFTDNQAIGGAGGTSTDGSSGGGGGGGGLGFAGGNSLATSAGGGGGGGTDGAGSAGASSGGDGGQNISGTDATAQTAGPTGGGGGGGDYDTGDDHLNSGGVGGYGGGGGGGGGQGEGDGGGGGFGGGGGGGGFFSIGGGPGGFGGGSGGFITGSGPAGFGGGSGDPATFPGDQPTGGGGGGGAGLGGAIFAAGGTVNLTNDTFSGNAAVGGAGGTGPGSTSGGAGQGLGGAVFNLNGSINVTATTIASNIAAQGGGAIYNLGSGGEATQSGPALPVQAASVSLTDSILAYSTTGGATPTAVSDFVSNTVQDAGASVGTVSYSGTNNIIQSNSGFTGSDTIAADPLLSPLAANGGPTETMALPADSPAIGAGTAAGVSTDQRGFPRPSSMPDLGAYQYAGSYTITVNSTADALDYPTTSFAPSLTTGVTLRDAINAADNTGGDATIVLGSGATYDFNTVDNNWYGPDALPPVDDVAITLQGNGSTIERDSGMSTPDFRFFYVSGGLELPAGSLTLNNLTLTGGLAQGGSSGVGGGGLGAGGAIFNQGALVLDGVTLDDNQAIGGSSGVSAELSAGVGGGGIGQDGQANYSGGGFGGSFPVGTYGGAGGSPSGDDSGGGGGFLAGSSNGANANGGNGGAGGGLGGLGGIGDNGAAGGDGGGGGTYDEAGDNGGGFGSGGEGNADGSGGGGGGVGGGGGSYGGGGFGGGGGFDANGGFGGGGGVSGGGGGFGGGGGNGGGGAGLGGAIFSMYGSVTVINSTLTENTAQGGAGSAADIGSGGDGGSGLGGAIFNLDGTVSLTFATIADNSVVAGGGGVGGIIDGSNGANGLADGGAIYNLAYGNNVYTGDAVTATVTLTDSILAGTTTGAGDDLVSQEVDGTNANNTGNTASVTGSGPNIVVNSSNAGTSTPSGGTVALGTSTLNTSTFLSGVTNANLDLATTLTPNSGYPATLNLLTGSPAIGAGVAVTPAVTTDERGATRPNGSAYDLGAFQTQGVAPTITSANTVAFAGGIMSTFDVTATGTGSITFSEVGSLPSGVNLSSSGVLSGTPAATAAGDYPITITASNGVSPNGTQSFTLDVVQVVDLTISTAATNNVSISGGAFSATGVNPNINITDLQNALVNNANVTITNAELVGDTDNIEWLAGADLDSTGIPSGHTLTIMTAPTATAGNLSIASNVNLPGDILLSGQSVAIDAAVTSTGTLFINSAGSVTQASAISAANLSVAASGNVGLSSANTVSGTLAIHDAALGAYVEWLDADGFTVGTVAAASAAEDPQSLFGAVSGVSASGNFIALENTSGNMLLGDGQADEGISATGGGGDVRLESVGAITQNSAGDSPITAGALGIVAGGNVELSQTPSTAMLVSIDNSSGYVRFVDSEGFSVGTVGAVSPQIFPNAVHGVTTVGGDIGLQNNAGSLLLGTGNASEVVSATGAGGDVRLESAGSIYQIPGSGAITAAAFAVVADGNVDLSQSPNTAILVAMQDSSGFVRFVDSEGFTVGTVGGIDAKIFPDAVHGISTAGGDIGLQTNAGNILLGNGNASEVVSATGAGGDVRLDSAGAIMQNSSAGGAITAGALGIVAHGNVDLSQSPNTVFLLAASDSSGFVRFVNSTSLVVGTVGGVSPQIFPSEVHGVTTVGGDIALQTNSGSLQLGEGNSSEVVSATGTGGDVRLESAGSVYQSSGSGAITAAAFGVVAAGTIQLSLTTNFVSAILAIDDTAAGAVSFSDSDAFAEGTVGAISSKIFPHAITGVTTVGGDVHL